MHLLHMAVKVKQENVILKEKGIVMQRCQSFGFNENIVDMMIIMMS